MNAHKLIEDAANVPEIFKTVLNNRNLMVEDETIIDYILIESENPSIDLTAQIPRKNWKPSTLVIATNYGLILLQEGGVKIAEDLFGYHIIHLLYDKVSGITLDICLLDGVMKILTPCQGGELAINFNTAQYFKQFERFVANVRKLVIQQTGQLRK